MSDYIFDRKKGNAINFSHPSLVSPATPTLTNPTRGFGLSTNNVIQTASEVSTDSQETLLEKPAIQEKPPGHDISRISFHLPQAKLITHVAQQTDTRETIQRQPATSTTTSPPATPSETNAKRDATVQSQLEQFLDRFSNIQVDVKWVEQTATQCVEKSETVNVHPPYFINKDGDRKTKALKNRQQANQAVKGLLNEIARPLGDKRGGMGMSRTKVGKSTPEDIQAILQKAIDRNIIKPPKGRDKLNADDLQDWLVKYGLGVDCSGFVSQALNQVMMGMLNGPLSSKQFLEAGSSQLKGGTNNFTKVKSPAELRPGDTMHIPGHIRIITSVQTTTEGYIEFTTAESSSVGDIGPTANVWHYEKPNEFKGLKRKKEDKWVAGDAGKTITYGRYKQLDQVSQPATETTGTSTPNIEH